jgi:nickel/cobalt transporter (NicO) family protein
MQAGRRGFPLGFLLGLAVATVVAPTARSHDIPNERVDRSIQVTVGPGRLEIAYEVSLSELTLTQDLRALTGTLPGGDRSSWLARYAEVTGPLNAKGLVVAVDGQPVSLSRQGYRLVLEEHPRYTFRYEAAIPEQGSLRVRDLNFVSSEGTSRLGVRGRDGVNISGDNLAGDVEQITVRPVWQLSDEEERRTRQVDVRFASLKMPGGGVLAGGTHSERNAAPSIKQTGQEPESGPKTAGARPRRTTRVSELLDDTLERSWIFLGLLALVLGAAHAIQPGHGKTLVTAAALGPQARLYQPVLLGLATTLTHMGSVLLVALALWLTGATQVETVHTGLARCAGFVIASAGFWRIGRYVGGYDEHEIVEHRTEGMSHLEVLGLGIAGGLVPCWDAVGLVVLAAALGRLGEGVALVLAFSAGMAFVLVVVGWLAWKFKARVFGLDREPKWQRRLGLACGMILSAIGLYLFLQA